MKERWSSTGASVWEQGDHFPRLQEVVQKDWSEPILPVHAHFR
jgi:hypothetical protein